VTIFGSVLVMSCSVGMLTVVPSPPVAMPSSPYEQSPPDGCSGASQKVIVRTTIYVMTMTRTTVYLPLDAKRRLSAAAHRQHRSEAELIRDAVSRLLAEEPESPRPNPPQFDLDPAVVDHVDEYLSAGFGTAGLEDGLWGA
jgi:Ribbon-helix-helix protein, copG family